MLPGPSPGCIGSSTRFPRTCTPSEGVPPSPTLDVPLGAVQGKNSWGTDDYRGPAPPPGHGVHQYHFRLYAFGVPLHAAQGLAKMGLLDLMPGHFLEQTELVGTYQR